MNLNDAQRAAAKIGDGPVVIVAGPGTGKTKTLAARILHLLEADVRPEGILALTFTRKSAEELASRLQNRQVKVSTFHGLCHELLGGEKKFVSEPERQAIIKNLNYKKVRARDVGLLISRAKNASNPDEDVKELVDAYNQALAARGLMDFDDLLRLVYDRLKSGEMVRPSYDYILVDEFQDTNDLQYELLKFLRSNDNLFVIGDPFQSIYGFRGASAEVFDRFRKDFPGAKNVTLATNYRSVPQVVALASAIFPDGPKLRAHTENAGKVRAVEVLNEYGEADWVVNEIEKEIGGSDMLKSSEHHTAKGKRTFRDFAVLYRTHKSARQVERALENSGIPYQVAGEGSPYGQPGVTKIVNALSYLVTGNAVPLVTQLSLDEHQIQKLFGKLSGEQALPELAENIIKILGIKDDKHLVTFRNSLQRFKENTLEEYLAHLGEIAEQEYYDPVAEAVTLLTIHAAKGLEFNHVFLIAAEQGILPHENANAEEERRLFYVAATRVRENLDIVHARYRSQKPTQISKFITEIPNKILPKVTDSNLANQQRKIQKRAQKRSQTSLF